MKAQSSYLPIQSNYPLKGLATTPPSNQMLSSFSPNLLNVNVRDGIVQRRAGYMKIGQTLDGIVLGILEFNELGQADNLIILTSLAQYYYDALNDIFIDVSREETTSYVIDTVTSAIFTHDDADVTLQFPDGSRFVVAGSAANDGTYTVASTAMNGLDTEITTVEIIPDTTAGGDMIIATRHIIVAIDDVADEFDVAGDVTPDFPIGATIYVRDSTDNNGTYTVEDSTFGDPNTQIEVNESIPDESTLDGDLTVRDDLTYTEGTIIDSEPLVDVNGKRLLVTNGVDFPIQWSGVDGSNPDHFYRWVPLYVNFVTCKHIKVFKEHLHLGNVITSLGEPQLIAWSDSGDFEDFTNGNAGAQILYELTTGIQALENLGDRMIVYSRDAIASGIFVGGTAIFQFETIIPQGTRLASTNGIVSINVGHVYASEENIYLFDGTRGLRTLGDIIRTEYKDIKDQDLLHRTAILNDFSKRTIYISLPKIGGGSVVYTMEYNAFDLAERAWAKEEYADAPRAFGFWTNIIGYTWDDTAIELALAATLGNASGFLFWGDEVGPWGNEGEQIDFPIRTFGDASGNVYIANDSSLTDAGTSSIGHYETADASVPEEFLSSFGRWGELEFEASGTEVKVSVLTKLGSSTLVLDESLTLIGAMTYYRVPFDVTARTLRVRFEFSGSFKLRWVKVWVKPAAAR